MPTEIIDRGQAAAIINSLAATTTGPREAYGILCLAIYMLNFDMHNRPISVDELAEEVAQSLRSIRKHTTQ